MAQVQFEVVDKLPPSATEAKAGLGSGKYKALYQLLGRSKQNKTFFVKVPLQNPKKDKPYLRHSIKSKFGDTFDILNDEYNDKIIYIRKNPYKN